jgi:hypothetical protein
VVQCFEPLQIDQQHGITEFLVAVGLRKAPLQPIEKESSVGQVGETVVQDIVGELLFGIYPLRDIAIDDDQLSTSPRSFLMVLAVDSSVRQVPFLWRSRYCILLPTPVARASQEASRTLKRSSG